MREAERKEAEKVAAEKAAKHAAYLARLEAKMARMAGIEVMPEPVSIALSQDEQESLIEEPAIKPKRRRRKAAPKKELDHADETGQERESDLGQHLDAS